MLCIINNKTALLSVFVAALLFIGCSSSNSQSPGSGSDSRVGDGGRNERDGTSFSSDTQSASDWNFIAQDDGKTSPAAYLSLESCEGNNAWLQVVVRGVSQLQGIAFRLKYDPQQLEVLDHQQGDAWTIGTWVPTASNFAVKKEGELWAGIGFQGTHGFTATSDTVVARVQLALKGNEPIAVNFRDYHNLIIDPQATAVKVAWMGGTFQKGN